MSVNCIVLLFLAFFDLTEVIFSAEPPAKAITIGANACDMPEATLCPIRLPCLGYLHIFTMPRACSGVGRRGGVSNGSAPWLGFLNVPPALDRSNSKGIWTDARGMPLQFLDCEVAV